MTPEQKQRAQQAINDWSLAEDEWDQADVAAFAVDLIKDLIDAPEQAGVPDYSLDEAIDAAIKAQNGGES